MRWRTPSCNAILTEARKETNHNQKSGRLSTAVLLRDTANAASVRSATALTYCHPEGPSIDLIFHTLLVVVMFGYRVGLAATGETDALIIEWAGCPDRQLQSGLLFQLRCAAFACARALRTPGKFPMNVSWAFLLLLWQCQHRSAPIYRSHNLAIHYRQSHAFMLWRVGKP